MDLRQQVRPAAFQLRRQTQSSVPLQLRDERKKQAAANVQMEKDFYGDEGPMDDETFDGISGDPEPQEEEYEGEELISRVVVEEFRLSGDEDDPSPDRDEDEDGDETLDLDGPNANMFAAIAPSRVRKLQEREAAAKVKPGIATKHDSPVKKPAKRFTYESKAARRAEATKQKARRMEKAESGRSRTGGKTGRGAKASGKKRGGKR